MNSMTQKYITLLSCILPTFIFTALGVLFYKNTNIKSTECLVLSCDTQELILEYEKVRYFFENYENNYCLTYLNNTFQHCFVDGNEHIYLTINDVKVQKYKKTYIFMFSMSIMSMLIGFTILTLLHSKSIKNKYYGINYEITDVDT